MIATIKRRGAGVLMATLLLPAIAACGGTTDTGTSTGTGTGAATSAPAAAVATTAPAAAAATTAPAATMMMEPTMMAPTSAPAATTAATTATGGTTGTTTSGTATTGGTTGTTTAGSTTAGSELPEVDPATVTGDFVAAGSSTVFPLTQKMVERFREDGYKGNPTVDSIGTGAGLERFCNGETDIANASRAIKEEETAKCQTKNITPIEFRVGTDALSIVVSAQNTFVKGLTKAQLNQIFSGAVKTWNEVDASYPNQPIQLFSPGSDSGTFDYFTEIVFADDYKKDKKVAASKVLQAPGIQLSENDNVLAQGVEGSPNAIGYFGYAYFQADKGKLRAIPVDGVEPNAETAEDGTYPISRPLFIYTSADIMKNKPQVAAFVNYYLTNVNDEIDAVGYFPASDEALNEARSNWTEAN